MSLHKIGERTFSISFKDEDIIAAGKQWIKDTPHADAPELIDLLELRDLLEAEIKQDVRMICPNWLRNRLVQLRKQAFLKEDDTELADDPNQGLLFERSV